MAVLNSIPEDRIFTKKDDPGVFAVVGGVLYRKWSEHCDRQGIVVVAEAYRFCKGLSEEICLAGSPYEELGHWYFELWLAEDRRDWFIETMKKRGFYKQDSPEECSSER